MFLRVLFLISIVFLISCAGLGESIGRSLDPDYGEYLDNRTMDQEIEDEKRAEEVRRSMDE